MCHNATVTQIHRNKIHELHQADPLFKMAYEKTYKFLLESTYNHQSSDATNNMTSIMLNGTFTNNGLGKSDYGVIQQVEQ